MTTQTISQTVNGVAVQNLENAVGALKEDSKLAFCTFRARNRWIDGGHNRVTIQDFYALRGEDKSRSGPFVHDMDEPPILCGGNKGANPVEYILSGLSGCLTTTLVYYAALAGIELTSVESEIEGDLDVQGLLDIDGNVRTGFQNIRIKFHINSDAPREKIEELVRTAQRFSPVFDTVTNPVPVKVRLAD